MMAIEKAAKRGADGMINSVETKKRRVEFADEVMVHDEDGEKHSNQDFSAKLYRNFVLSAIEDVERVCLLFFLKNPPWWFFSFFPAGH